ncbi:hypothetical protein [Paraconexibacter sp. AEG42_29]
MPNDPWDPADQPTRHLPPAGAARPRQPVDPRPPADPQGYRGQGVDALAFENLAATVRTLRATLIGVALVTVAALLLGFYALSQAGDDDGSGGSSSASSSQLDDRVDRLSRQVQKLRSGSSSGSADTADLDALKEQVDGAAKASDLQSLREAVDKLGEQAPDGGDGDAGADVSALSTRVDELANAVEQLQQQGGTTTP